MITFRQKGRLLQADEVFGEPKKRCISETSMSMAEPEWPLLRLQRLLTLEKRLKSWYYEITNKKGFVSISFHNSNIQNGVQSPSFCSMGMELEPAAG